MRQGKAYRLGARLKRLLIIASIFPLAIAVSVIWAPYSNASTGLAHVCKVVVDNGTTQGVFCLDLVSDSGGVNFNVEAICQYDQSGVTTQCSNVSFGVTDYAQDPYWTLRVGDSNPTYGYGDGCGHAQEPHPNCVASGRNYFGYSYDGLGPRVAYPPSGQCLNDLGTLQNASINLPGDNKKGYLNWSVSAYVNSSGASC